MKRLLALVAFVALPLAALAGGSFTGSDGSSATSALFQSSAAIDLSVNPDGGQTSGCLGATSAATDCRSVQVAIDALPKGARHQLSIFVDAGTYTENLILSGFRAWKLDAGVSATNAPAVIIKGSTSYTTTTLSGGTATGTATSFTAASGTTPTVMGDTTQAWIDGGLVGHYLKTSLSATVAVAITANNANTVTLHRSPGTIVPASTTYTICDPSTRIVASGTTVNPITIQGNESAIALQDIRFESGSNANGFVSINDNGSGPAGTAQPTFTRVQFVNTVAGVSSVSMTRNRAGATFTDVIIDSVRSGVLNSSGYPGALVTFGGLIKTDQSSSAPVSLGPGDFRFNAATILAPGAGAPGVQITTTGTGVVNLDLLNLRVVCPASSTAPAIFATGQSGNMPAIPTIRITPTLFASVGCLGGVALKADAILDPINSGVSLVDATGSSGTAYGYALAASARGFFTSDVHTFNFTNVTNQITLDGTAYTVAQVAAYGGIISLPYGTAALSGAAVTGPKVLGPYLQLATPTLGTCGTDAPIGSFVMQGGSGATPSRICWCLHITTATDQWCSQTANAATFAPICTGGSTTVCP